MEKVEPFALGCHMLQSQGSDQDDGVRGHEAHLPLWTYQKYIYIWKSSHWKLIEDCQMNFCTMKVIKKRKGIKAISLGTVLLEQDSDENRDYKGAGTATLRSKPFKPHPGHPRPGVQCERGKPPWLAGGLGTNRRTVGIPDLTHGEYTHWFAPEAGRRGLLEKLLSFLRLPYSTPQPKMDGSFGPMHSTSQSRTGSGAAMKREKIWLGGTDVTRSQGSAPMGRQYHCCWRLLKQHNKSSPDLWWQPLNCRSPAPYTQRVHKAPFTLQNGSIAGWLRWRLRAVVKDKRNLDPRLHLSRAMVTCTSSEPELYLQPNQAQRLYEPHLFPYPHSLRQGTRTGKGENIYLQETHSSGSLLKQFEIRPYPL